MSEPNSRFPERRPRVLVIAEAANPEWVSVPLVGWSLANALRQIAEVHLVTQVRNRAAIERAGLVHGRDFTAINSERVARPLWKAASLMRGGTGGGWTTAAAFNAIAYPYFERLVWRRFGAEIAEGRFDIVHRVTPLSPALASPIARRCRRSGVPFVLGPVNGGVPWPPGFGGERRREREWLSYVRAFYRLLPARRTTLTAASAILVGSRYAEAEIPPRLRGKTIYLPENAVNDAFAAGSRPKPSAALPLRACFIGRLVPLKCVDILLDAAVPFLRQGSLLLDVIGDGPMLPQLKASAERHGVSWAVTFHGWVEHRLVPQLAARSTVFAFPSVKEFGGGAVIEAMSLGLVPLVVDYGGPGELVTEDAGVKVQIGSREVLRQNLETALGRIIANPSLLPTLSDNASERVRRFFTWSAKAQQIAEIYRWVLSDGALPQFGFDQPSSMTAR